MDSLHLSALLLGFFLFSALCTGLYRRYALSRQILDIPNHRSAHTLPVPRGGGVIFVLCFLAAMLYFSPAQMGIMIAALGIAAIGYYDDKYTLAAWKRLCGHVAMSLLVVQSIGTPDLQFGIFMIHANIGTTIFAVVFLVWMLNLYNFMDGINGLASSEAICVALGMSMVYQWLGIKDVLLLPLLLAATVSGFLVWNFPKAKLFMGDAGSGFLGFVLGVWALQAAHIQPRLFWSWVIFLGVFIVDATITLLTRIFKKQPIHIAHSTHAYQHTARRLQSHTPVTLMVIVVNIVWLWPIAAGVGLGYLGSFVGLLLAYLPLCCLGFILKAGRS